MNNNKGKEQHSIHHTIFYHTQYKRATTRGLSEIMTYCMAATRIQVMAECRMKEKDNEHLNQARVYCSENSIFDLLNVDKIVLPLFPCHQ